MTAPFRLLVTGSRKVNPRQEAYVRECLQSVYYSVYYDLGGRRSLIVVQGECPYGGVDLVAKRWAEATDGVTDEPHSAAWEQLGKAAGPTRNSEMVRAGADLVLAFPTKGSRGTWDCLQKAVNAGIPPRLLPLNGFEVEQ